MATQWKFTAKRGGTIAQVTQASGTTISGGDAIEVNVDADKLTQAEFVDLIDKVKFAAIQKLYPAA